MQNLTQSNFKFPGWVLPAVLILGLLAFMVLYSKGPTTSRASLSVPTSEPSAPCFIDTASIITELQRSTPDKSRIELGNYLVDEYSNFTRSLIIKYQSQ